MIPLGVVSAAKRADFTEITSITPSSEANGDYSILPRTGWVANDWDDGGHTHDASWHIYKDASLAVIWTGQATHMHYDTTSLRHEVESTFKMNGSSGSVVGGVMACGSTDVGEELIYIGFELVIVDGVENKTVVYYRDGATHDEFYENFGAALSKETWYTMRLRYDEGVVSAYLDGVLVVSHTLTSAQQTAVAGHTRCGPINYSGSNNWGTTSIRALIE